MGNDCSQCEPIEVCGRDALRKGLEGRAKLDLSHLQNNNLKENSNSRAVRNGESHFKVQRLPSTQQKQSDEPLARRIQVLQLKNGAIFQGEMYNSFRDGLAKVSWPDGTQMTGNFKKDRIVDSITLRIPDKGVYEGSVKNGGLNGKGKMVLLDGETYEGEWKNGKPDGRGSHTFPDGSSYQGDFFKGAKTGKGKFVFKNGSIYTGDFLNGQFHGQGYLKHQDGRQYTGEWKNGMMHGHGTIHYNSSTKYVGNFHEGERQGRGIYSFGDGRSWEGEWSNNLQNGKGRYSDKNGQIEEGIWKEGHLIQGSEINKKRSINRSIIKIQQED